MCGIVAYAGKEQAVNFLIESLRVLEYRGYDSSGVAIFTKNNNIQVKKASGKLIKLIEILNSSEKTELEGSVGIGHTRWATHGAPSDINSHPQTSESGDIILVHNGIINNYLEIKNFLIEAYNTKFVSDTDTEVIANLLSVNQKKYPDMKQAIRETIKKLEGNFALCILSEKYKNQIFLTCKEAPLIVGKAKNNSWFCASDSSALLSHTGEIYRLKDFQIAQISQTNKTNSEYNFQLFDENLNIIKSPEFLKISQNSQVLDKAGFKHYLLKEIHEQPVILRKLFSEYFDENLNIKFPDLNLSLLENINKILILGCGTAYYAGMVGKFLLETIAGIPTEIEFSSEILVKPNLLVDKNTLVIAISQSGETADTLMAVKKTLSKQAKLISINNRPDSTLACLCKNSSIFTYAGTEVSVAATKSFTAQLFCLYILAMYLNKNLTPEELLTLKKELHYQPQVLEQILSRKEKYREAILPYSKKIAFIFLGRGINYPIALEGALKLKEITYLQATGYAAGEMKHGPIATLDEHVPTISILLNGKTNNKTFQNVIEAQTRGSPAIAILHDEDLEFSKKMQAVLFVPKNYQSLNISDSLKELINPFACVLPLQLVAYYIAEYLGKDVDQPRNLAKSVTVE